MRYPLDDFFCVLPTFDAVVILISQNMIKRCSRRVNGIGLDLHALVRFEDVLIGGTILEITKLLCFERLPDVYILHD